MVRMTTVLHTEHAIRRVLREHGRLAVDPEELATDTELGLTRNASLNVLLALEGEFDVEFPDRMIRRDVLRSIGSIERALRDLIAA